MIAETIQDKRFIRNSDITPQKKLDRWHAYVVGVGAVGRQVALQLQCIGCKTISLIDPDTVDTVNVGPQGYPMHYIGHPKVDATGADMAEINSDNRVYCYQEKFELDHIDKIKYNRYSDLKPIIFFCTDSIGSRKKSYNFCRQYDVIDGRVSAETIRVFCVEPMSKWYDHTFFPDSEAYPAACTSKMTIYTANMAGAFMVSAFTHLLRGIPNPKHLSYNLLTNEFDLEDFNLDSE